MEIAPGIDASKWKELDLDNDQSSDWNKAIEIFQMRIEGRYLEPVDLLIRAERNKPAIKRHFGFTILAIDCLLIETLQAFRDGKKDTRNQSSDMFKRFLAMRPSFKRYFNESLANRFYTDFRCGILHQAEIRGGSRVWSVGPLTEIQSGQIKKINRTEFHNALKLEFHQYLDELKNPADHTLRKNFREKMDYICTL